MSETDILAARIDSLEMRIAYQDETIEDLNQAVTAQWKQIDILMRQIAVLHERLQEAETNTGSPQREPPPPHY